MARKIIACDVIKEELMTITPEGSVDFEFLPMGLHDWPDKLRQELQTKIDQAAGYELIILGYGLCGQAARGLEAKECPLIIPRVHECIPLLLGSQKVYEEIKKNNIGTHFLSGGWTEGERTILGEHRRICEKFGQEEALELLKMIYKSYNCLMFINTCHPRLKQAKGDAREVAWLLEEEYHEASGTIDYLAKLINGPWDSDEFILVENGQVIDDKEFRG